MISKTWRAKLYLSSMLHLNGALCYRVLKMWLTFLTWQSASLQWFHPPVQGSVSSVLCVVESHSHCMTGLQALYDKYKDRGFIILGFPCNQVRGLSSTSVTQIRRWHNSLQFGGQEPGDDAAISQFCERNHGVTFPLMKKSDVNGDGTNEVYKYLKNEKAGLLGLTRIKVCAITRFILFLQTCSTWLFIVEFREILNW